MISFFSKKECDFIKMNNRKKLLLVVNILSIYRKIFFFEKKKIIKINDIIKWHLIQSNFMGQISFQLPNNTLLLATIFRKKHR